jgi:hypothetical protein
MDLFMVNYFWCCNLTRGGQAVAVPSKLHPGFGGVHNAEKAAGIWGSDREYAELLEKF